MANKFRKSVVFQNKAAANRMAANYRKQFGLGLDGEPRSSKAKVLERFPKATCVKLTDYLWHVRDGRKRGDGPLAHGMSAREAWRKAAENLR